MVDTKVEDTGVSLPAVAEAGAPELVSVAQIAERFNVSLDTIRRRVKELEVAPVVEAADTALGRTPALYDFTNIKRVISERDLQVAKSELSLDTRRDLMLDQLNDLDVMQQADLAMQLHVKVISSLRRAVADKEQDAAIERSQKEALQIELDRKKDWFSVKRVLIETGREYAWRPLKKYSKEHGYDFPRVFDQNYGEVNAYHIDVWHAVYGLEL